MSRTTTKLIPQTSNKSGDVLTFHGKSYRKVNLDQQWTLKQDNLAAPIISKLKPQLDKVLNFDLVKGDISETTEIDYQGNKINISRTQFDYLKKITFEFDAIDIKIDILPLLYIEVDEPYFNKDTYEDRKSEFENMPHCLVKEANDAIVDFLHFIAPSMVKDSQTFLQAIMTMGGSAVQ